MATATVLGLTLTLAPTTLTALRLAPAISTTASLTHAYKEWLVVSSFYSPPPTQTAISQAAGTSSPTSEQTAAYRHRIARANEVALPAWFTNWFNTGVWSVIGLNSITGLSAAANLLLFKTGLEGPAKTWYWVGWAAAIAHMAFVPLVQGKVYQVIRMSVLQEIGDAEGGKETDVKEGEVMGRAQKGVRDWIAVHRIRMVTVDVVAWVAFAVGAVKVLTK